MRTFVIVLAALSLLSCSARSQEAKPEPSKKEAPKTIGAAEAAKHYDEDVIVTGKVAQVSIRPSLVFLNLDQPYPNSPLAAVIFTKSTNQFGDLSKLKNQDVEIKGQIKKYNDKPEIVLDNTNQLTVLARKAGSGNSKELSGLLGRQLGPAIGRPGHRASPTKQLTDTGEQLFHLERLAEVGVGARFRAHQPWKRARQHRGDYHRTPAVAGLRRSASHTLKPFMPGNSTSRTTKSGGDRRAIRSASSPVGALRVE